MGYRAQKHSGQLLAGVPAGYLRKLLTIRSLPGVVRTVFLQHTSQFCANPDPNSEDWVPVLVGEMTGWLHKDVYEMFLEEWRRLSRILGSNAMTPIVEAMVVNSHSTPTESLV